MKKRAILLLLLLLAFSFTACGKSEQTKEEAYVSTDGKQETLYGGGHVNTDTANKNTENKIKLEFQGKKIVVVMKDNSAARSLLKMLPLVLKFEDYAGTEKISYLPEKLDTSDVPSGYDPSVGDLTYYAPWGNLAFFYKDHGYANGLVPLGTIESGADVLSDIDGDFSVTIEKMD